MKFEELVNGLSLQIPSPLQELQHEDFISRGLKVFIKRDDLIHPEIQGNKWRKLLGFLKHAKENNLQVLTFGGAFSNHVYATAAACDALDIGALALIRGEYVDRSNYTLRFAASKGMRIIPISLKEYTQRNEESYLSTLRKKYPKTLIVPEGGNGTFASNGIAALASEINTAFPNEDIICVCPIGTATTFKNLVTSLPNALHIGINCLKNESIEHEIKTESSIRNFKIYNTFHFGGFAKANLELVEFINNFRMKFGIQLEPIYTGKMMYALFHNLDEFKSGSTIVCIHTGGLQGIIGFNQRYASKGWEIKSI